ncbi:hypothetical protein THIAE_04190 [Thiomicrospira aerophila AL3]|uniref:Glycosyl transferase family 1 domain-containing protein n=1 Tax=Thiomicrospira aerophila AL3 TaxID=717772 RepID=W0DZF4_9GAMM|nr:hypothetical protein THIAE_04190 [Thiomicrospira aerophila AL3]
MLIEALILSTPVVSTDCPTGPNEILTGSLQVCLANYRDTDDISKKALKALDYYPVIQKETLKKFSFEGYIEKLIYLTKNA